MEYRSYHIGYLSLSLLTLYGVYFLYRMMAISVTLLGIALGVKLVFALWHHITDADWDSASIAGQSLGFIILASILYYLYRLKARGILT
jgi:hypothetical protein